MILLRFFRLIAALGALLLTMGLVPAEAQAQRGVAGRELSVCILRDSGGMNPADLIRHPEKFDCTTPQHKMGSGSFWVVSQDIHQRSRSRLPLAVRSTSLWEDGVDLYTLYGNGKLIETATGKTGVTPLVQLGAVIEHPLPREDSEVVRVMWHVRGAANVRGILLGARLATQPESISANLTMAAIYAAFAGLCIALIVYNLALWAALRHNFQIWYCAMVAGLLAYAFTSSGAFAWAFPEVANNDRLRINYLGLGLMSGAMVMFARTFFEERVFEGWLGKLSNTVAALIASAGIGVFLMAPYAIRVSDKIFTLVFIAISSIVIPTLWRAWQTRSNYLWLFAIAWGAPILTAVCRLLGNLHVFPWNFWLDNSTILAMVCEALLSSVAIAYRIRVLSEERDAARQGEEYARQLAAQDPLTGLLNRRSFLEQAIGRSGEQVLQIADLDYFKRVNDTLGHDGGDEVLRVFARMLRSSLPAGALIARIGGEEFAILSAAHEAIEPEILLARLRATRMPFDLTVTASIGTCTGPLTSEREWKALYRGADAALFEAKSAGRDRARNAPARAA